jgi:DNA mismatch endonuclease (patch repair protein)
MSDRLTAEHRSWNMSRIGNRDTKPEKSVRSILHRMGYRFTVNGPKNKSLQGKPDIVLPKHQTVIFVHGCFWHRHRNCNNARIPKTRTAWWKKKLLGNVNRDNRNRKLLRKDGWQVIVVWECDIKRRPESIASRLDRHLARKIQ